MTKLQSMQYVELYKRIYAVKRKVWLTSISNHIDACSGHKLNPVIATESRTTLTRLHPTHITVLQKEETLSYIMKTDVISIDAMIICHIHILSRQECSPV